VELSIPISIGLESFKDFSLETRVREDNENSSDAIAIYSVYLPNLLKNVTPLQYQLQKKAHKKT
tara:strand:+ start:39 stop:230 length:192 start_codon:yes stop_codon:yes gene_type:complete